MNATTRRPSRFTHSAELAVDVTIGPEQCPTVAKAGTRVLVWQDPALQAGDLITICDNHHSGVARVADLRAVASRIVTA